MFDRRGIPDETIMEIAAYVSAEGATVRQAAALFGISKSTVHKELSVRLKDIDEGLYEKVYAVMQLNKQQRHIRGGNATREKYRSLAAGSFCMGRPEKRG